MSLVIRVDPSEPRSVEEAADAAAEAIDRGRLVVLPTDTVYGLLARPDDARATDAVFRAKRRPAALDLPVLVPDEAGAWTLGVHTPAAGRLAEVFWPGALTLILARTRISRPWSLGDRGRTIALRVPGHPLTAAVLARTGPVAATSANLSGAPPLDDPAGLTRAFGEEVAVYVVLAADRRRSGGTPSTVVDVTTEEPRVVRQGAVVAASIERVLRAALG